MEKRTKSKKIHWKNGQNSVFSRWKNGQINNRTLIIRKINKFLEEFYATSNNALLLTGARQVGKTHSIRQFGKRFESFVEINFVESPDAIRVFREASDARQILLRLSGYTGKPLVKGKTLVFFDEVQACPEIVTAIKFLVEEGSYRYILSGSLLGVELNDLRSEPVGYLSVKEMFPLDFEEFIRFLGVSDAVLDSVKDACEMKTAVDVVIHSKLIALFRLYLIVGGMPAVVSEYAKNNNLQTVLAGQQAIMGMYKRDISKYDHDRKLRIEEIFNLIPPELNAQNKRFVLKNLNENAKFSRYEDAFIWLKNAGVALPVYNVDEPRVPLLLSRSRNLFKLFLSDVGLLCSQFSDGIQLRILSGDKSLNFGAVYENAIAQELVAHGFPLYYYNNKKRGEVDFVTEDRGAVLPIEVKSGKNYARHRALCNILDVPEYAIPHAIVFSNDNLWVDGKTIYAPVYMAMFLSKTISLPIYYKPDLEGL